jgi:ATP-dependent RNA helicase DeaD
MIESNPFCGVPAPLRAALDKRGFIELTPVQQAALAQESQSRNLRISSQTGSGKTVALGLRLAADMLERSDTGRREGPRALLITPTRELAVQVGEELRWLFAGIDGVAVEVVTGGTDAAGERRALARNPAVVVGTPGRLLDHLRRRSLRSASIEHVVLDEADQMLDMGFREELDAILEQLPEERQSHLVSATFPKAVEQLANRFQADPLHIQGSRPGEANADIRHLAHRIRPRDLPDALVNVLLLSPDERALVFVRRRLDATELARKLSEDGFSALPFSGELTQAQRTQTLESFKSGSIRVLVATDVAARGIDIPKIDIVIHADVPGEAEAYTHRSGRTGRAGRKGRSILLCPAHAERHARRVLSSAGIEADWQPVPTPEKIEKSLTKRVRRRLHANLGDGAIRSGKQTDYARSILENHDAVDVIAALLDMAQPDLPRPPVRIEEVREHTRAAGRTPQGRQRGGPGASGSSRGTPRGPYERFEVNWGRGRGATPDRILSHVCRRGRLDARDVGAIRIDPSRAVFEISAHKASDFEKLARRPDERDPHLMIRRVRFRPGSARSTKPLRWPGGFRAAQGANAEHGEGEGKYRGRSARAKAATS